MLARAMVAAACAVVAAARRASEAVPFGVNIGHIAAGDRTMAFVNLVKQSYPFASPCSPTDANATVDAAGWPTEDFSVAVLSFVGGTSSGNWPAVAVGGVYTVAATGNATVWLVNTAGTVLNQTYDEGTNQLLAFVALEDAADSLYVSFNNTQRDPFNASAGAGLTDVMVLQPGYTLDQADDFSDAFLAHMSRFDIIRGLGWTLRAPDTEANWSDRSVPANPSYTLSGYGVNGPGVPWEVLFKLANQLGCDVWINVPSQATDDYITQLALLVNSTLDPTLAIYTEYANEVWNGHFTSEYYNKELANASVAAGDPYHFTYDNCTDASKCLQTWAQRRYGLWCKHIGDIFASVFGRENVGIGKRVRPVLAGQGDDPTVVDTALQYLDSVWGPPSDYLAVIAIAPYFGMPTTNTTGMTPTDVLTALNSSLVGMSVLEGGFNHSNAVAAHAALATMYGMQLRGYEGGPATTGPDVPEQLWAKANATVDPRMADLVYNWRLMWAQWGAPSVNFHQSGATGTYAFWGAFGVLVDMREPVTPKSLGIDAARNESAAPEVIAGISVPTAGWNVSQSVGCYSCTQNPVTWLPLNTTMRYLVRNPQSASEALQLNITIWASSQNNQSDSLLEVQLGCIAGRSTQLITVPYTGKSESNYVPLPVVFPQPLQPGQLATVQLRAATAFGYRLDRLDFAAAQAATSAESE